MTDERMHSEPHWLIVIQENEFIASVLQVQELLLKANIRI
jgi:hypothetical protein